MVIHRTMLLRYLHSFSLMMMTLPFLPFEYFMPDGPLLTCSPNTHQHILLYATHHLPFYLLCVLLVWPLGGVAAACIFLHSSNVDGALSIAYWDAVLILDMFDRGGGICWFLCLHIISYTTPSRLPTILRYFVSGITIYWLRYATRHLPFMCAVGLLILQYCFCGCWF